MSTQTALPPADDTVMLELSPTQALEVRAAVLTRMAFLRTEQTRLEKAEANGTPLGSLLNPMKGEAIKAYDELIKEQLKDCQAVFEQLPEAEEV